MTYKLVSVKQMQAVEKEADSTGITYAMMMEDAGRGLARVILEAYPDRSQEGMCGLIGTGNNGGDALVALTYAAEAGWTASAYILRPREECDPLTARLIQAGGSIYHAWEDNGFQQLDALLNDNAVILDGVLGTGIKLPLRGMIADVLDHTRQLLEILEEPPVIVAVDCPSGVDCDSGDAAPETIPADLTVTMAAVKQGLFRFPANHLVGNLVVIGIGLPQGDNQLPAWKAINTFIPDTDWIRAQLPVRPADAHKGTFGTALILAGSMNYTGAALLAGKAAYRIGAGLVTLAIPAPLHSALAGILPEATWLLLPEIEGFLDRDGDEIIWNHLERVTAMLIGPGLGLKAETGELLNRLLHGNKRSSLGFIPAKNRSLDKSVLPPLVIDADGLKLLMKVDHWPELLPEMSILTPHPGEMSILTGLSTEAIQSDRLEVALRYSRQWKQVVILKGAFTIVAAPDGQAALIPVATAALARAGTGDVLAGLVVGLRAQGLEAFPAAVTAAWIHAQAGFQAAEEQGNTGSVLASDVLNSVASIVSDLLGYEKWG
jgi:NAD(P)H-hydrate epimerase